jgi:(2R)-3-sulfolactate dehydrogenase (NADP+)
VSAASRLTLEEAHELAQAVLTAAGASPAAATATADALVAAEADGIGSHGLSRLPAYADQLLSGKIDGGAVPELDWTGAAALRVDARCGFAFPAIAAGLDAAMARVAETGLVAVAVRNSHHAGVMGHHVERVAAGGFAGLGFSNSPAAIAPWGGAAGVFGTNPIAFAAPRPGRAPLVVDTALSKVARGKIMLAAQQDRPIPEGWALDRDGRPTTDAKAALKGTMLPMGDAKGAALVLAVEVLAAALTGGRFGFEASSFFTADGSPPRIGQLFLIFQPERLGGSDVLARLEVLLGAILAQPGTRLPGDRRQAARERAGRQGIAVDAALLADLRRRAARPPRRADTRSKGRV